MATFAPGLTPTIGLAMTGDAVMNQNLQRIDTAMAAASGGSSADLTALTDRVAALEATVTDLEARLAALEAAP